MSSFAAARRCDLFTNLNAPDAAQYPGAELIPTFAMFLYQDISNDPMWSSIENFVVHNRSFHRALSHLDPSMFEDLVTVFPTLSENQVLGLVRWLATFPKEKRPSVAVGLRAPQEFTPSNTRTAVLPERIHEVPVRAWPWYRGVLPDGAMRGDDRETCRREDECLSLPCARRAPLAQATCSGCRTSPMVVSFVGGARRERGGALLPEIVKRCASPSCAVLHSGARRSRSHVRPQHLCARCLATRMCVFTTAR